MKIKLLKAIYLDNKKIYEGETIELIDSKAATLIASGHAIKIQPVSLKKKEVDNG